MYFAGVPPLSIVCSEDQLGMVRQWCGIQSNLQLVFRSPTEQLSTLSHKFPAARFLWITKTTKKEIFGGCGHATDPQSMATIFSIKPNTFWTDNCSSSSAQLDTCTTTYFTFLGEVSMQLKQGTSAHAGWPAYTEVLGGERTSYTGIFNYPTTRVTTHCHASSRSFKSESSNQLISCE